MNYMDLYLQQFLKSTIKNSIDEYKMILDKKLKSIESYINYLSEKRVQLKKLIDSLTSHWKINISISSIIMTFIVQRKFMM